MQEELDLQVVSTEHKNTIKCSFIDVTAATEDMVSSIQKICMEQGLLCFTQCGSVQVELPSQRSREARLFRAMNELQAEFTLPLFKD